MRRRRWFLLPWALIAHANVSPAQTAENPAAPGPAAVALEGPDEPGLRFRVGPHTTLRFSPLTDLYPDYIASPRRARHTLTVMQITRHSIAETSKQRLETSLGGSRGAFRIHPDDRPDRGFQFQVGGAIFAQWDAKRSLDGIGWDGTFQFLGTWTMGEHLAVRTGINHLSRHVIDEYVENTRRARIGYTREQALLGLSYRPTRHWRTYGEFSYAYHLGSSLQERLRVQAGLEYESGRFLRDVGGWYFALDSQSHEENDWDVSASVQVGLVMPLHRMGRTYRLGFEYYRGRSTLGEFFLQKEDYVAFGWWLDF